eukprot:scaffold4640_cov283-Chaetoceros_neogracile.AAC.24
MPAASIRVSLQPQNYDQSIKNFSNHCMLYYEKSLSIHDSETTSDEDQEQLQASKIILDALEHQIINVHTDEITVEYRKFLESKDVHHHSEHLKSCGLFAEESRFKPKQVSTISSSLTHQALAEYTKVRDLERRNAHQMQMTKRRIYLEQRIKGKFMLHVSSPRIMGEHLVTSQAFLKHARGIITNFVRKYKSKVGSHSLLAGIAAMMKHQIEEDKTITLWTLNGSTLSEVNFSSANPSQKHNGEVYMEDAIELLSSFMLHYPDEDEAEKGTSQKYESMYSFFIHGSISNSFLRYMLSDLPSSHELHAKPTGKLHIAHSSIGNRDNADGFNDEYTSLISWTQGLRCEIL